MIAQKAGKNKNHKHDLKEYFKLLVKNQEWFSKSGVNLKNN